jgi:hypothetical protein
MGSFTATQAQTKTRKAQIVLQQVWKYDCCCFFKKNLFNFNIFYFLKVNFDINKSK